MTVEQIKKNAKVMLAFTQGNEIQARPLGIQDENAWKDESSPNFDFNLYEYRVKENTESEYRPFENIKECWEEMLKHQPFGWIIDVEPVNSIIPSEYADAGCIVNVGEDFICLAPYLQATNEGNVQNNSVFLFYPLIFSRPERAAESELRVINFQFIILFTQFCCNFLTKQVV